MKKDRKMELKQDYYNICYDCLYFGYTKAFIFKKYDEIINKLGNNIALGVYQTAFDDIANK